ncbi:DUF4829 domain-containing protein [Metabacillus malikii]|uniref:DUF4829 domain-containing protein n=1 Tax=Metabacillus malikii TaxID=1504265 RepID=A0ABT9ZEC7_9BACI|nr:DUF4829 domain-containing protein [Metabacillus malikii]MDQ0230196.1 hypothetical protein [Metabacillus malikii]
MKVKVLTVVALVSLISIVYHIYTGKVNQVQVTIGESNKFTDEEINEAVVAVKKKFHAFQGCTLTELWYSEEESNERVIDYLNYGTETPNEIKEDNIIVLLSNFDVNSSGGDGSFEPNSTQTKWQWILIRDSATDKWRVEDWGY